LRPLCAACCHLVVAALGCERVNDGLLHRRDPEIEKHILGLAAEVKQAMSESGECPDEAGFRRAHGFTSSVNAYRVSEGECMLGYWTGPDTYYEYWVKLGDWVSSAELRGCRHLVDQGKGNPARCK
jgi:hypothetical protein